MLKKLHYIHAWYSQGVKIISNILKEWYFKYLRENETEGINRYKRLMKVDHVKAIIR